MYNIDISILIPAKNEAANLRNCLTPIFSQTTGKRFEVILVDSGSTDGSLDIARSFPIRVYQIPPEEFHHARTRNYLASLAAGKFLVYLNADAFPATSDWLECLLKNFADPTVGAVYGKHLPKSDCNLERRVVLSTMYGEERIVKDPTQKQKLGYRYYHLSTVNAAIRKSVWNANRVPEELKIFEDVGIAKRMLDAGWKIVYEPSACVYHSDNHTARDLFKRYFDLGVIWKKLGMWDETAKTSLFRDGWKLLRRKISTRERGAPVRQARVNSIVEDAAKYAGLMFGKNENLLPLSIKRRMSSVRIFD